MTRLRGIRSTVMTYDTNNRLLSETIQTRASPTATPVDQSSTAYTYDAANNRASKTVTRIAAAASSAEAGENEVGHWEYTYNAANQLTAWEKWDEPNGSLQKSATLTYDDAGNRTGQTVDHISSSASDETTSYTWDAQDRLLGVTMPDGSQHGYAYDYRTRRIGTTRSGGILPPATTRQTAIVFSGGLSVAEWESDTGSLPVAPTVEYMRGPDMGGGVGGLLYSLRDESTAGLQSAPVAKYNLSNGRGDIVAQSNQSAALTWTASYAAYGKRTKETGENQDKQRGNSKDEDPTGLLNEGFRYRDLETDVWMSRDPAGFVDGPNLYAYVKQNPWTGFDPDGLFVIALPVLPAVGAALAETAIWVGTGVAAWYAGKEIAEATNSISENAVTPNSSPAPNEHVTTPTPKPAQQPSIEPSPPKPTALPGADTNAMPEPHSLPGKGINAPNQTPDSLTTPGQQSAQNVQEQNELMTTGVGPNGGTRSAGDQKRIEEQREERRKQREKKSREVNGQNQTGEGHRNHEEANQQPKPKDKSKPKERTRERNIGIDEEHSVKPKGTGGGSYSR